ncbi:hypothetical protein [Glycomyces sp. MUSA5-2]|uniref:hypothetical protein n=1 Tax=Glycomyces sp. MUSA5-2 TaxID=2053002 RepID=UPI003009F5DA
MLRRIKSLFSTNPGSQPAVAEATVDAFVDTVTGTTRPADPVTDLAVRARSCAALVESSPEAFSPVHLAHTVAAVVAALAQMGEVTGAYVIEHWSRIGAEYAEPAGSHLWQALDSLALTAGLLDVAIPAPAPLHQGNALTALQEAAAECAKRVCTTEGEPVAAPAEVARAVAQILAALAPVFAWVQAWVNAYVPGRGRELPETARRHLHEAIGRWAPIAGLITHVPADPRPEPEAAPDADGEDEGDAVAEAGPETEKEATDPEACLGEAPLHKTPVKAVKKAKKAKR